MVIASGTKAAARASCAKAGRLTDADVHVGRLIRQKRLGAGMTQADLAALLGISFQQVQKYERGIDRVGAGRLLAISRALDVPVASFYEGFSFEDSAAGCAWQGGEDEASAHRERLELIRAYNAVEDPAVRQQLRKLVQAIAARSGSDPEAEAEMS